MQRRADVSEAEKIKQRISDNLKVITDYVENELKPEEVFVNDYAQPLTDVYAIKNEICEEAQGILIDGLQATNEDVRKLEFSIKTEPPICESTSATHGEDLTDGNGTVT